MTCHVTVLVAPFAAPCLSCTVRKLTHDPLDEFCSSACIHLPNAAAGKRDPSRTRLSRLFEPLHYPCMLIRARVRDKPFYILEWQYTPHSIAI
ncbi:hypothetical protein Pdw03_7947 [Penicillium digitatum]|uniref:Secreted protein n=1 Tax=Penicillium digitatum TaxID=36651 RepID=A0A7T7BLL8_PENDI|nr:hypothetical protein Pdw03_7947 [Penicillium digitatum]